MVKRRLLRSISRQERRSWVPQILQSAAPEDRMPPVGRQPVIRARDEDVVIQAGGCAKNKARIIQTIARGEIVRHGFARAEVLSR